MADGHLGSGQATPFRGLCVSSAGREPPVMGTGSEGVCGVVHGWVGGCPYPVPVTLIPQEGSQTDAMMDYTRG